MEKSKDNKRAGGRVEFRMIGADGKMRKMFESEGDNNEQWTKDQIRVHMGMQFMRRVG